MGAGIRNLWVKPSVHVLSDEPNDQANRVRRTTVKIDGLLCRL
jgi:hypothetical protein